MHKSSGRWRLGLALALTTAVLWGFLPIGLVFLLEYMDAYTIVWYRFLAAALTLLVVLTRTRKLPKPAQLRGNGVYLLSIAILGLAGNYILYMMGLERTTPGSVQIVIQLAPVFLLLGGLLIYRETFSSAQWLGLGVLLLGLALFFNRNFNDVHGADRRFYIGLLQVFGASVVWAAYALAQKQLLNVMNSQTIMFCLYVSSTLLFLPLAQPASVLHLDALGVALLLFCCLNTLVAYGSFAEALAHWEASRISAILAITPLITLLSMLGLIALFPTIAPRENLNTISWIGALLVVCGSVVTARAGDHTRG
ncbi:MAG: DMT family transporter [Pseudomonadales bacterium]